MAIQFLRGTSTQRASSTTTLAVGQPFYETDTGDLYIGTGGTLSSTPRLLDKALTYDDAGGINLPYHTVVTGNKLYLSDGSKTWEPLYRHDMIFTGFATSSTALWVRIVWYSTANTAVPSSSANTFLKSLAKTSVGIDASMYHITGILSSSNANTCTFNSSAVYPVIGITNSSASSGNLGFVYIKDAAANVFYSTSWSVSDTVKLVSTYGW